MTEPAPAVPTAEEAREAGMGAERPVGPPPVGAMAGMGVLFLVSIGLAMLAAPLYATEVGPIFEDPEDIGNAVVYMGIVIAFTAVILLIARYKAAWLIQAIILFAVLMSLVYLFGPLLERVLAPGPEAVSPLAWGIALALGAALTLALWKYPEWWVIDASGIGVSAGAGAYFGISFGLLPCLALLVLFATYDAIAVYRTKHMIDLADKVMDLRLPIMLIVPKKRGYSFLREEAQLKAKLAKGEEREALFMGLGDIVLPCVLVVSALMFLEPTARLAGVPGNVVVSVATLLGAFAGYVVLMGLVAKGKAHAGLPSLNGGAILGFLAALLPLYGLAPLVPA